MGLISLKVEEGAEELTLPRAGKEERPHEHTDGSWPSTSQEAGSH